MSPNNLDCVPYLKCLPPFSLWDIRYRHQAEISFEAVAVEPLGTGFSALTDKPLANAVVLLSSVGSREMTTHRSHGSMPSNWTSPMRKATASP